MQPPCSHCVVCRGALRAHTSPLSVVQALTFYRLTHPRPSGGQQGHEAAPLQPRRGALNRRAAAAGASGSSVTAPGSTLPHAIAVGGAYSGVVYTAPASGWRREDTVANWPPTVDPSLPFRAWQAAVEEGTLVLCPILPPPGREKKAADGKQHGSSSSGGSSGDGGEREQAAAAAAAAVAAPAPTPAATVAGPPAAATKVGIPLEGCTVELVTDGLNGRSDLIRRAPLLVSHPRWKLLEGEPAFYLWAGGWG
jgi:hypothetical protein